MSPNKHPNTYELILLAIICILAFAAVGSGDYADAKDRENAQLRAAMAGCRLAQSMGEPQEAGQ